MEQHAFESPEQWRSWLREHHATSAGVWIRIFKKGSGVQTVSYADALDEALCFGWIDGQKQAYDERSWLQKFTPRRPKSAWSKRNTEHVARLIKERRMMPMGLKEVEEAKADGRWNAAYASPSAATVPDDFLKALAGNTHAKAFFETLNRANVYAITYRLETAKKPETRAKRMQAIIEILSRGEKFH